MIVEKTPATSSSQMRPAVANIFATLFSGLSISTQSQSLSSGIKATASRLVVNVSSGRPTGNIGIWAL